MRGASKTGRLKTVLAYFTKQAAVLVTTRLSTPGAAPATDPVTKIDNCSAALVRHCALTQACSHWLARSGRLVAMLSAVSALGGCSLAQAPAFFMFGSYFPSWLVGTAVAIVLMIPLRWILIRTGIDDALPLRLLFYICLVLIIAMVFSYTFSPQ